MTEKDHDQLIEELQDELYKIHPGFKRGFSSGFFIDGEIQNATFELLKQQSALNETNYALQNTKTFIHYTSLEAMYSILNSQTLRMYNLKNMNDPKEFDYLLKDKDIEINEDAIETFKKSLFISSFCEFNSNEDEDFNLWRLYGNHGNGVGIIFELKNEQPEWHNFIIGKVNYSNNSDDIKKLKQVTELFNHYVNKGLKLQRFPELVGMFFLLNKNPIWSIEKEYRIMTFLEYDEFHYKTKLFSNPLIENTLNVFLDRSGTEIGFVELPILQKIKNQLTNTDKKKQKLESLKYYPNIEIKEIIIGYNLGESLFKKIQTFVTHFSTSKIGKYIPVRQSIFTDSFK